MTVDEMHRVPLDAPAFRLDFGKRKAKLFSKRRLSRTPVPIVCITATMTKDLLKQFEEFTGIDNYTKTWGTTSRRNIKIKLAFLI